MYRAEFFDAWRWQGIRLRDRDRGSGWRRMARYRGRAQRCAERNVVQHEASRELTYASALHSFCHLQLKTPVPRFINRRVFDSVEWSGVRSSRLRPRNSRNPSESDTR